jgi:hypothetical protein
MGNGSMARPYNLYRCPDNHEYRSFASFGVNLSGEPSMKVMACRKILQDGKACKKPALFVKYVRGNE